MSYYVAGILYSYNDLYHHGIKGMRWGVRRYTNPDGTLTEEGKRRYGTIENFNAAQQQKRQRQEDSRWASAQRGSELLDNRGAKLKRNAAIGAAVTIGGSLVLSGALSGAMTKAGIDPKKAAKYSGTATTMLARLGLVAAGASAARDIYNAKKVERQRKIEEYKKNGGKINNNSNATNTNASSNRIENQKTGSSKYKTAAKIGAGLVVAGVAVYGAKKLNDAINEGNFNFIENSRQEGHRKIDEASSKAIKKNQLKWLLGGQTTKLRDTRRSNVEAATKNAHSKIDKLAREEVSDKNYLNKIRRASQYYKDRNEFINTYKKKYKKK